LIHGPITPAAEISVATHRRQDCLVVLPHLVSGDGRCAFRSVASTVAELLGNKRNRRLRFTDERANSTLVAVKPLADLSTISHAILRFELFGPHKRPGVYPGPAIAAGGAAHVCCVMRDLHIIRSRSETNSTAYQRVLIDYSPQPLFVPYGSDAPIASIPIIRPWSILKISPACRFVVDPPSGRLSTPGTL
jgi:hypothetical protein